MRRITAFLLVTLFIINIFSFTATAEQPQENLSAGLPYNVCTGEPISDSYGSISPDGIAMGEDNGKLSDNVWGDLNAESAAWYKAYGGKSRNIVFDFGENRGVDSAFAIFLHSPQKQIYLPRYIKLYLSDNGTDYQLVGEKDLRERLTDVKEGVHGIDIALRRTYSARYAKLEYATDGYVYCSEVAVYGNSILAGTERPLDPKNEPLEKGYTAQINQSKDIVKLYNGHAETDHTLGVLTEDELLPYVAYVNSAGEIKGKMFDSVLLSPCNLPADGKSQWGFAEWEMYLSHTFTLGQDLDALNKVAGRAYQALGITDKLNVYFTIPYPALTELPFGDIDNDGTDEYSAEPDERLDIVKWYVSRCIDEFKLNNYEFLNLSGFFLNIQGVDYTLSLQEEELIKDINKYIKRQNLASFYSSAYLFAGFDQWEELGFTAAVMQSNYGEHGLNGSYKQTMLSQYAKSVYNNRMGVEIGFSKLFNAYDNGWDYQAICNNYEAQLYYGGTTGYMNAVNLYEQGMGIGFLYNCCYAKTSSEQGVCLRRIYDITYRYINGNYNNMPPEISGNTAVEITEGDAIVPISIADASSYWGDISVIITAQPANGKVAVSADKTAVIYSPESGFAGVDSFTLCVSDGFSQSKPHTVNVTVAPVTQPPEESEDIYIPLPPSSGQTEQTPPWLFPMIALLAGFMVVVAIATVAKSKKK